MESAAPPAHRKNSARAARSQISAGAAARHIFSGGANKFPAAMARRRNSAADRSIVNDARL